MALEEHDVEYAIDYREENEAIFSLRQFALNTTQDVIALGREKEIADVAQNEANYDSTNKIVLSGESQFSHANSDPFTVFDMAKRAIKRSIGRKANVCIIAGDVWQVLKEHPKVIEKIKYVQTGIITPEIFAKLIDVDTVKIGEAVYEESSTLKDIWTDTIVLAYVAPRSTEKKGTVYLQTLYPENAVLQALIANDRDKFLTLEKKTRKILKMPPYGKLAAIIVTGNNQNAAENVAIRLGQTAPNTENISTLGPAPAPIFMLRGKYRYRLLLKTAKNIKIQDIIREWLRKIDCPSNVRIGVDIDPYSFM